ncbi:MAG: class I SAM-dependent methyltransferase [Cyanobacteriota bacterium]|nr:class I SAM-dependent methyltransferase [Cyanobacteriota bacterium]
MAISPLTGSSNISLLENIKVQKIIENWQDTFQIDITEELGGYAEIQKYQCNQTQLKFFFPQDIAGSEKLYQQLQQFDWYYMADKWEYEVAISDLLDCNSVLEIGSGSGAFVKRGSGIGLNIRGIETNTAAVRIAQHNNIAVEKLDLKEAAKVYSNSMDAVCSFQVLEHLPDPKSFIELSLQILKANGKLIFAVPNANSFLKYKEYLLDLPPHHMSQWSQFTFKSLEQIFPLKLKKSLKEPLASCHVPDYIDSYSSYLRSISPAMKLFFNHYTLPFYLKILNSNLRKILTGQSLYVQFRKTDGMACLDEIGRSRVPPSNK